ncbi:hypothetical protein ACFL6S_00330 [Candidatus Poribacteria bacterium]
MKSWPQVISVFCILFLLLALSAVAYSQESDDLILRAGNAEDEKERYELLKGLEQLELDEELRDDLSKLLPVVDQWANGREKYWESGDKKRAAENGYLCGFFVGKARPERDYPPKVREDSPLYPIWCMYRARMLIQMPIQSGNLSGNRNLRDQYYGEGRRLLKIASDAFPKNRVIRMYLDEPIAWSAIHEPDPNAPKWANLQRESLEKLTYIIHWWIDERQTPDGQFGGGWGDDVEMWRNWTPILIGFDDPKVNESQARLSNGLFSLERMSEGYTSIMSDVEHTAEDSGDTCTAMMHIDPDNPVWEKRALRMTELMRDNWTGINERGFLQFKSTYFNVNEVDLSPKRACDSVYHPRAVQPALLYWQRTGDEELEALFSKWMDTWVDAAGRAERGKPAGIIPSAIHWPDGHIGGTGENWWQPENYGSSLYDWPSAMTMMTSTLLLTSHMTGDDKYLKPIESMATIRTGFLDNPPTDDATPGSAIWCARNMGGFLPDTLGKYRLLTGNGRFDRLLLSDANGYVRFRLTGDGEPLKDSMVRNAQAFRVNREGYTSEVRWTDRVFVFHRYVNAYANPQLPTPHTNSLYGSVTGDFGNPLYFPMNAVRWKTTPQDIAVLVTDSSASHLSAELYHFGDTPREMGAELYLLSNGEYEWTITADEDESKELLRGQVTVDGPRTLVSFALPPRRSCVFRIRRLDG